MSETRARTCRRRLEGQPEEERTLISEIHESQGTLRGGTNRKERDQGLLLFKVGREQASGELAHIHRSRSTPTHRSLAPASNLDVAHKRRDNYGENGWLTLPLHPI